MNIFDRLYDAFPFGIVEDVVSEHLESVWKLNESTGFDHENIPFLIRILTASIALKDFDWDTNAGLRYYCLRTWYFDEFPIPRIEFVEFEEFCKNRIHKHQSIFDWVSGMVYGVLNYNTTPMIAPKEFTALTSINIPFIAGYLPDAIVEYDLIG